MAKPSIQENMLKMLNTLAHVTAEQIAEERKRNDAFTKATWDTLSRRERPVFVNSLRQSGFTQQEIADTVRMSQPSIAQYEKKFRLQSEAIDAMRPKAKEQA